ncbi:putative dTDP-4-dehydrorhamnose 3,5-epimerase [Ancylostoma caninum]|uniref:Putative dTDP-4-dehydrorhamnose 3,5-epimerase n=1 Tax=Ancylostoma caninum TaxID=29170 RepID=A0A368FUV0_ANCCA|nr:putative dTDP-4-dehydrorhamnose 3,5-epimerase [Ancylostoma caninum]
MCYSSPPIKTLQELDWKVLMHPSYPLDLAPTEYHLFRSLFNQMRGLTSGNEEDLENWLTNYFEPRPREFWRNGTNELVKMWEQISGEIFDVAVDVRPGSATYGQWHGVILNGANKHAFWLPDGFAHGFQCLSPEGAHVTYKCTGVYNPSTEYGIDPFDKEINVNWPIVDGVIVSERDRSHKSFAEHRSS